MVLTKSQFESIAEKWKADIDTAKVIIEEIKYLKSKINETQTLNEGIADVLKKYLAKGLLSVAVLAALLSSGQLNAQDLTKAGIPQEQIQRAVQITQANSGSITPEQIDAKLIRNMKRQGQDGALKAYLSMKPESKQKLLSGIQSQIKSLTDIDNKFPIILGYVEKVSGANQFAIDQKTEQKIVVDTAYVRATLPITENFGYNSTKMINPEAARKILVDSLNTFVKVDSIVIVAHSSTLRNTGELEGTTWLESSTMRAEAVKQMIVGITYDVGGQKKNPQFKITDAMVKLDVKGENGDGTSGPPSPYESDPAMIAKYKARGIDPKFWDSNAKGTPYADKEEYKQHQLVEIIIYGQMVETKTVDIVNIQIATLREFKKGKIEIQKPKYKKLKLNKCPVKV